MTDRLRSRITAAAGVAAVALAALTILPASASSAVPEGKGAPNVEGDLGTVRKATAKYQDVKVAIADGYHAPHPYVCVESDQGVMGYHYLRWDLLDDEFNIKKPELLIYVPNEDGKLELVAVEYMRPDADQDLSTDDDRPTLFDRPFDGPMEGHEEGMPRHYDLHAWIWSENPSGTFAQWNPAISC
ncbi:MAG: hypothetical protein GEU94_01680 [Micromonosporaceae bacterium]|nr:hypothetical protein [Micromonosporaceae bacterium]